MDKNRLILAMVLSMTVIYGWMFIRSAIMDKPQPPATQPAPLAEAPDAAGTQPAGAVAEPGPVEAAAAPDAATGAATQEALWHVRGADERRLEAIGEDTPDGRYRLQAFLSNRGASVERILAVAKKPDGNEKVKYDYALSVTQNEPYPVLSPLELPDGRQVLSWTTQAVRLLEPNATVSLADVPWNMQVRKVQEGIYEATFWVEVLRGQEPVLRIVKRYRLAPDAYNIVLDYSVESLTGEPVRAVLEQSGPVGIRREDPRYDYRKLFVVLDDEGAAKAVKWQHAGLVKSAPVDVGGALPIWWLALADKYFAAVTAPIAAEQAASPLASAQLFTYTKETTPEAGGDLAMRMVTPPLEAQPGEPVHLTYDLFVGPKEPDVLAGSPIYVERQYMLLRSAEYAWCTFSGLGELLTRVLHFFYRWIPPHNYGLAIIILVLLVRALLHPLTKHQGVAMARMQQKQAEVAPKLDALKRQYANDRQKLQVETMRVYREAGINPAGQMAGCLPMLIQMPIWVALYSALNYDINLWHEPFVLWIRDLSAPDALFSWDNPVRIPILSWILGPIDKFNLLPILLATTMYLQQKLTPKPKIDPTTQQGQQQLQMQKMMGFMMIFFGMLFYNMPSGLNLYIMASSLFGAIEQRRIRRHIAEQKERPAVPQPAKPKGSGWWDRIYENLEKKARDSQTIRREK